MSEFGKVYLVGAGPGDPGLITVRGRALLECADVVIYDALIPPELPRRAARAERIFVGKQADRHSLPQEDIHRILIEQARRHACVVRLKGGDPFVFGRGGEEAAALAAAGVPFEVVPGVTAGVAGPAYAGIPVTQRGLASSVTFLSAHGASGDAAPLEDVAHTMLEGTQVVYMGVAGLPRVVEALIRAGRAPDTPAAVIEWATFARQRTIAGTLETLCAQCRRAGIETPALVVVGPAAALHERLRWFEKRPLHGLRVAVTHAEQHAGALEARLRDLGADVFAFPAIRIEAVDAPPEVDLAAYDWVLLMSVNAVDMLFHLLARSGRDARALAGARLCVAGTPSVLEAVRGRYLEPDAVPAHFGADAVVAALEAAGGPLSGKRVLLPRADVARSALPAALRARGAAVEDLVGWRKAPAETSRDAVEALLAFAPEVVVFTNAAAVGCFASLLDAAQLARLRGGAVFASLGPVTTAAAREQGLEIQIEPPRPDTAHLIEAVCAWRVRG
ncbi:MAG TPA: uroporphyrinogen-III C-methyltransferase [Candidatus Hydrogenedentes bacterium]|nr:uroporphyrinogen-III C-methyltransferase [Candidatus Hydrogenedentota bacterium]